MGVPKPAAEILRRVLDQAGVGPAVAVHVGEDPVTDVAGARGVGMRAIHHVPDPWVTAAPADGVLHRFAELPGLVARLP
jgi:FMN phosphatase YigB (HAD superfamily)